MSVDETKKMLTSILEKGVEYPLADIYESRFVELRATLGRNGNPWSLWIYAGRERDHILVPYVYCSCMDFIIRTIFTRTRTHCKHQLGLLVAIKRKMYRTLSVTLEELYVIVNEILEKGFSPTLRRKLYK
ncbi:MAG: metal-binding protein [Desulfurococcaceae archaeon]|jgi:predicted nucleic acid-binding Zn finger protein|nr:metal-binding protein [Desulfurococcaceae archaeon]